MNAPAVEPTHDQPDPAPKYVVRKWVGVAGTAFGVPCFDAPAFGTDLASACPFLRLGRNGALDGSVDDRRPQGVVDLVVHAGSHGAAAVRGSTGSQKVE